MSALQNPDTTPASPASFTKMKCGLFFFPIVFLSHPCHVCASRCICAHMHVGMLSRPCFCVSVCVWVCKSWFQETMSVLGRITLPVTNSDTFARKLYLHRNTKYGWICHKAPIIPPPLHQVQTGNAASQTLGKQQLAPSDGHCWDS